MATIESPSKEVYKHATEIEFLKKKKSYASKKGLHRI